MRVRNTRVLEATNAAGIKFKLCSMGETLLRLLCEVGHAHIDGQESDYAYWKLESVFEWMPKTGPWAKMKRLARDKAAESKTSEMTGEEKYENKDATEAQVTKVSTDKH
jgi:hypothetical protein